MNDHSLIDQAMAGYVNGNGLRYDQRGDANEEPPENFLPPRRIIIPGQTRQELPKDNGRFCWAPVNLEEFFAKDYTPKWLVENIMVEKEPLVIGGVYKCQKTNISLDLAVSLASGTPFLCRFAVARPMRVAVLSAESGEGAIQTHLTRICQNRGLDRTKLNLRLMFDIPQFEKDVDVNELSAGISNDGVEVAVIDPTYLGMFTAGRGDAASNFMVTGPLLRKVSKACLLAGATPAFDHHAVKRIDIGKALELKDLSMAGFAEFFRQWILLNHYKPFDVHTGRSQLIMNVGGSAGHHSLWGVGIDEGPSRLDLKDRTWGVVVQPFVAEDKEADGERQDDQDERESTKDKRFKVKFLMGLDDLTALKQPTTKSAIKTASGLNTLGMDRAIFLLLKDETIEPCTVQVPIKNGKSRPWEGFQRKRLNPDNPGAPGSPRNDSPQGLNPDDLSPPLGGQSGLSGLSEQSVETMSEYECNKVEKPKKKRGKRCRHPRS